MTFLNPFVLFGLLAASLPVLFHLFAQRRAKRVEFSSLQFLQKLEKTSMRAVKIRQILLLIVRTLLVVAVVMAFARPALRGYLGSFFGATHANTSLVFLIDNSASMSRSDTRGELLKQAKSAAAEIANIMEEGDEAVVIPLAGIERGKLYSTMHGRNDVLQAIDQVSLADRPALLPDGLRMASAVLSKSLNVNKEVYLLTDGQQRNLKEANDALAGASDTNSTLRLFGADTKVLLLPLGSSEASAGANVSIDSLKSLTTVYEPGRPVEFEVFVRNTSGVAVPSAVISLFYGQDRVAQQSISNLGPAEAIRLAMQGPARGAGMTGIRAEVEQDALPFDNKRFTVINIPVSRHIGIFTNESSDATFVTLALQQSLAELQGSAPFTVEQRRLDELVSLTSGGSRFDAALVMLGSQLPSEAARESLAAYVSRGAGAAIFMTPGIDIPKYNQFAAALKLPRAAVKEGNPYDNTRYVSFSQIDFAHPFFSGLFEERAVGGAPLRGIESPRIFEYYVVEPQGALPLIRLSNGKPFALESRLGAGSFITYVVPPTLAFSDLPRKSVFLPLSRRTAAYLASIRSRDDENRQPHYVTTEPFDVSLPPATTVTEGSTVLIKSPDGVSSRAAVIPGAEGESKIRVEAARSAGNYEVFRDAEGQAPIAIFSVNIQSDESDLTTATTEEMREFLAARVSGGKNNMIVLDAGDRSLAQSVTRSRYGVELWQTFLVMALVLAIVEMLIARENRCLEVRAA